MADASINAIAKLLDMTPRRVQQRAKEGILPKPIARNRSLYCPIGSRVIRLKYSSRTFTLRDRLVTPEFLADLYYEAVVLINRWEPQIRLIRVNAA